MAQTYNDETGQWEEDRNETQNTNTSGFQKDATNSAPETGFTNDQIQSKMDQAGQPKPQTPTGAWNREEFKNRWMAQGAGQNVGDWLSRNQDVGQGVRFVPGSQDKVILPTGEVMDLSINSTNGTGGAGWTGAGGWDAQRGFYEYAPEGGGVPGAQGQPGGGAASSGTSVQMTAEQMAKKQQDEALRQEMLGRYRTRADQALNINAATDPNIRAQADPYAAAQERARRNYLDAMAEKSGPLANMQGETRMASERMAQNVGQFESELVGREIDAKRKEISDALTGMQGLLSTDEENMLREKLAMLDDATQRYGIQSQATTAANGQNLDWQAELLRNQTTQDRLGFDTADRSNYWDAINRGVIKG